jgi:hypothetical protein
MRYAGDIFDLLDGNDASIHYCAELNIFQVHSDRIIKEHETVGIAFSEENWFSEDMDVFTLQKAKACYGKQSDAAWTYLIRKKAKQQRALLEEILDSESEGCDSESDAEPEDKDPSDIPQERGEWTHDLTSNAHSRSRTALFLTPTILNKD